MFLGISMSETIFYLPNRFRQCLLASSAKIEAATAEKLLLDMMGEMFDLSQSKVGAGMGSEGFSLKNFAMCYRHFFRSTLAYESCSLWFRIIAY